MSAGRAGGSGAGAEDSRSRARADRAGQAPPSSSLAYRPEIDGLRALAIIPVVLFHLNERLLPGGFIGVDIFFVISGYLITSIVVKDHANGTFSMPRFWSRRARRILPALTVTVLATLAVGRAVLYAPDLNGMGLHGLATLLSVANISHWRLAGDYWGDAAETSPFLHAWSLSVEEQFYLVFPLLLVAALTYCSKRVPALLWALCAVSLAAFVVGAVLHRHATFYLLPMRAWELGVGAALAVVRARRARPFPGRAYLAEAGLVAVAASYFVLSGTGGLTPFMVLPVAGAALAIAYTEEADGPARRVLSTPFMVYVGRISYSLYLWHWPALVLAKNLSLKHDTEYGALPAVGGAVALAILSYHLVEVPGRTRPRALRYVLPAFAAALALSWQFWRSDLAEQDVAAYSPVEWHGFEYSVTPRRDLPESLAARMKGIRWEAGGVDPLAYERGGIVRQYGGPVPEVVVLGDSHALMWGRVLDEAARDLGASIAFDCADGTPVFFDIPPSRGVAGTEFFDADEKLDFDEARLTWLEAWRPAVVVISARWSAVRLDETRALIERLAGLGAKVLLIEQPPTLYFGDKNAPRYLSYLGLVPSPGVDQFVRPSDDTTYREGLDVVAALAAEYPHCRTVPTSDLYMRDGKVRVVSSFDVLYIDDDHLSEAGAQRAKGRIADALGECLRRVPARHGA